MRRKVLDMNLTSGIMEVDLHGLRVEEAVKRSRRLDRDQIPG
jgi:hypothetical protein